MPNDGKSLSNSDTHLTLNKYFVSVLSQKDLSSVPEDIYVVKVAKINCYAVLV